MTKLENFEDLLYGDPAEREKNLTALLPEAEALADKSIYLQILAEIALAQASQKNFYQAHKTLDHTEAALTPQYPLAHARILLERGRTFQLAGNIEAALSHLKHSYELSQKNNLDLPTNVAFLIAYYAQNLDEKILWYKRAIDIAKYSSHLHGSLALIHKELAQTYLERKKYKEALEAFKDCLNFVEDRMDINQGDIITAREVKWRIGHVLRLSGNLKEALAMQLSLLQEYQKIIDKGEPAGDLPEKMLTELRFSGRGMVHEELAKIYMTHAKRHAALSYADLSKIGWSVIIGPDRLEKMRVLSIDEE